MHLNPFFLECLGGFFHSLCCLRPDDSSALSNLRPIFACRFDKNDTFHAGFIIAGKTAIPSILSPVGQPQIRPAIIVSDAVDVIKSFWRVITCHPFPDDAMRRIKSALIKNLPVSGSRRSRPSDWLAIVAQNARLGIVAEVGSKRSLRWKGGDVVSHPTNVSAFGS